ncbi:plasma-membrane proton-efflux P-type ATPase [Mycobacterium interjectum]|nr:plasma-membrane proton-efflux P-type ATPase [Mycobacterium interjectum]
MSDLEPEATLIGLTSLQAQALLAERGPNTVPEQRPSLLSRVVGGLWAPVPWMLEATIILELVLGKWLDAAIVGAVLVFNAGLGFVQQQRAASALALLRHRLAVNARVCRDGAWQQLPAAELVDGDLVHVRVGDLAPADLRVDTGNVLVDQSSLTGESVPVDRGRGDTVYAGSIITRGEATATVTATGTRTYFGRTAELVRSAEAADHLAAVVLRMVRVFIVVDVLLAIAGTIYLAAGRATPEDIVAFAVVLLLASVPVALPAAFALAGALGARYLAGQGILTARLASVADAAEMDLLCVDKTGTITANRLAVAAVSAQPGASEHDVLRMAAGASDEATQDPIDLAILRAAAERGISHDARIEFVPFDPGTKRSEATLRTGSRTVRVAKGAPQVIAELAGQPVDPDVERLAANGARVLAVAATDDTNSWHQLGLVALADPPRPDAAALIHQLSELGITVVMVSGDNAATAAAVATQVGITGPTVRPDALRAASTDALGAGVIAEVLPEDKYRLIKRLQDVGHTVGMTGDGVNDAPALRQADVGIAVAGATDVAKSAAGIVLTREGLTDIVGLVKESRRIHQRSLTYALNVSVKKLEVPLVLTFGVFAWQQFVFTPLLMALLLLGNDVVSMAITTDRADYARRPDRWNVRHIIIGAAVITAPLLVASVGLLWCTRDLWPHLDLNQLRSLIFFTLIASSQATIYLVRTREHAWTSRPSTWLLAATGANLAVALVLALTGTLMSPLPRVVAAIAIGALCVAALLADYLKTPTFKALGLHRLWRRLPPHVPT